MKWTDRVGRRVKLRDLHIALAVAEAGSMTRAAEELAVSYAVVSKTISELEHTLGVKLFDRSISGVEPTHYGRALLRSGVAVFDEMRKGLQQIESIRQPDVGELRIGSSIVTLADLIGEPWVLAQPGSLARSLHEEVFRKSGLEPPSATVVTVSLHLYMRLIETGRWLGLVPASVMRFGGKGMRLKVLPVKALSPPAPVGFITVKDRTLTPLAVRFIECTRKVANSDIGRVSMRRF